MLKFWQGSMKIYLKHICKGEEEHPNQAAHWCFKGMVCEGVGNRVFFEFQS